MGMSGRYIVRFPALEGEFERLGENVDHYAWIERDEEAMNRLVSLVADAMQAIAADITDRSAEHPGLTSNQIVADLRERATELCPESVRSYDPRIGWGDRS